MGESKGGLNFNSLGTLRKRVFHSLLHCIVFDSPNNYGEHFSGVYNRNMQLDKETRFQKTTWDHCWNPTPNPVVEDEFVCNVEKFIKEVMADIMTKLEVC
jgi:hypothetical protein